MAEVVNLAAKLAGFDEAWSPRPVATFNGHDVLVVKSRGENAWHAHDDSDDLFLVLKGRLRIELRDGSVTLGPGELYVVPRGVEHRPVAEEEAHVLALKPRAASRTADLPTDATRTTA